MAKYTLNEDAVAKARSLIDARRYVLGSDWGDVQPNAEAQNSFLEKHSGRSTRSGTSGSPTVPLTRQKRDMRSAMAIFAGFTGWV